jgi:serine/threonine protein kinase
VKRSPPVLTRVETIACPETTDPGRARGSDVAVQPGLVLRDRFTLGERIACGGIGELFQAIDRRRIEADYPDPFVAIKVLSQNFQRMSGAIRILQYEAILAQRLVHPNLVRVFDIDRHAGVYFVTMEWLRGESLARRLNRTASRPMPWMAAERVLRDVANGLDYAHRNGVIHGDVKPANVFLTTECRVKLVDFGLACTVGDDRPDVSGGPLVLTPAYASCEIHEGRRPTVPDDVFSLAVMAYRMIAGSHPFAGHTSVQAERMNLQVVRPDGLSASQWDALRRGLAFRREDRLTGVEDLVGPLLRRPKKRLLKPWPRLVRVASVLYAVGLAAWYYGPNQVGGGADGTPEMRAVPEQVPSSLYSPPNLNEKERPALPFKSEDAIIALKTLSEQDAPFETEQSFFQET